jgi:hypothetical protein
MVLGAQDGTINACFIEANEITSYVLQASSRMSWADLT